jgi:hypothetical protein
MQKAQVMVIDLLFFSLIVILIIFIIINNVYQVIIENQKTKEDVFILEELLFVEKLISDSNCLAVTETTRTSICYKNKIHDNISEKLRGELLTNNVCKIDVGEIEIFNHQPNKIKWTITRGVIIENQFQKATFYFC